ncbi:MAG: hypothetical protein II905_03680 [Muribaculaceae bacterium]|nr:hypothetical protein [Muribaculaceae bacterium]
MVSLGIRILFLLLSACSVLTLSAVELLEGDLLFCCAESANAITEVTRGVRDLPIDHVAIVHRIGGDEGLLYVIEAKKPAVCLTPIDTFLQENPGGVLVCRVNADVDIPRSVRRCLMMVGKPYDDLFLPGDSALYCSELVQLNYVDSQGELIFHPVPMSFHDETGQVTNFWRLFYARRGMSVPEGAPGSNPGELSLRPQITIIAYRMSSAVLQPRE